MPSSTVPKELLSLVAAQSTSQEQVVDALEEWILYRRSKGDTLFQVSLGLAEIEGSVGRHCQTFTNARRLVMLWQLSTRLVM
jgi:hypothetical protein